MDGAADSDLEIWGWRSFFEQITHLNCSVTLGLQMKVMRCMQWSDWKCVSQMCVTLGNT